MSSIQFPDAIFKRDVLYGARKVTQQDLIKHANAFKDGAWLSDAVDFLAQAKDNDSLKKLREQVVQEGDTFLFLKISRSVGDIDESMDLLRRCAAQAESLGKIRYAIKALERVFEKNPEPSLQTKIGHLRQSVGQDGDILAEVAAQQVFIPEHELETEAVEQD